MKCMDLHNNEKNTCVYCLLFFTVEIFIHLLNEEISLKSQGPSNCCCML